MILSRFASLFRSFASDRTGNVVVITAFSILPLIGITGLAIDYSSTLSMKAKLDHAADAAALAGITTAQSYINSYTGTGNVTSAALTAGQTQGLAQFKANTGTLPSGATVQSTNVNVTSSGSTLTGTATYTFSMPTMFMKGFGIPTVNLSGSSSSTLTMASYNNIYVVIDTSSSMGIGATLSDQQIVYNATGGSPNGCAVACHYSGTSDVARRAGATLRIDVAKQAVVTALNQMRNTEVGQQYKVAIYTMSNTLVNVYPLSADLNAAVTAVNTIDLANDNYDGGTNSTYALAQLRRLLPTPGNGVTATSPKGTVMLITDGVQDSDMKYFSSGSWYDTYDQNFSVFSPCTQSNCQYFMNFGIFVQSFDPAQCTPIKSLGYTMLTLNVQYLVPPPNVQSSTSALNSVFSYIQQNLLTSIPTQMAACATTTSNAYAANTPPEIQAAVSAMFASVASSARLTR